MKFITFTENQQILHRLLLQAKFMPDAGLLYGQAGIMVALAKCFQRTNDSVYEDAMNLLVDQLVGNLNVELPTDFGKGLSGIGWGLEYLLQHRLVEGDNLEVCAELDERLMRENVKRITDYTLETGLEGRLHYILAHIQGCQQQSGTLPFDPDFLADYHEAVCHASQQEELSPSFKQLIQLYVTFYQTGNVPEYHFEFAPFVLIEDTGKDLPQYPLGMKDGLAGLLLKTNGWL